jgi:hypothetical protein
MLQRLTANRNFTPTVISIIVLLLAAMAFFHPILSGKKLQSSDVILVQGMQKNLQDYRETHNGEDALWSMSMFSGMPAQTIHMDYQGNIIRKVFSVFNTILPQPIGLFFLGMVFCFWLFRAARVDIPLALGGALAFGFFSYHIIITEAGHGAKLMALLFGPGVLASIYTAFNGKKILGSALLIVTLGLELFTAHVQITYYLVFIVLCYGIYELYKHIQEKRIMDFVSAVGLMAVAVTIAFFLNATNLFPLREYNEYTIRGTSELKVEPEARNNPKAESLTGKKSSGVDREYAFNWSNGRDELLTLLIPNFKGGASGGKLSADSEIGKAYGAETAQQGMPLYWGTQPFTSGPTYAGAVICFLFVLGMFLVKDGIRWALFYSTLLFAILSLGKNSISVESFVVISLIPVIYLFTKKYLKGVPEHVYAIGLTVVAFFVVNALGGEPTVDPTKNYKITDLLFDSLPLYNKFRAPASILGMVGITMAWLAVLGAQAVLDPKNEQDKKKAILYALGITAGIALIMGVMGSSLYDFKSASDAQLPGEARPLIQKDRASLLTKDAFRSTVFILFAAGLLFAWASNWIKNRMVVGLGIALLCLIDLFAVDARYLWKDDYASPEEYEQNFQPREADQFLLTNFPKDKKYYRVFPLNRNPFNDGSTPYHLNTIGGYNAAKLKRYQQLIEAQISKMNMRVINMLNTEFIISDRQIGAMPIFQAKSQKEIVYQNPENYGPAWFVQQAKVVNTPDEALYGLDSLDTYNVALVEKIKDSGAIPTGFSTDSVDRERETITIKKWENRTMVYESNSPRSRFAVFSEVYYPKGWTATIDGKEVPIFQTNFVLRGLVIPAGKHTIEFKYNPKIIAQSSTISYICSVIMLVALAGAIFYEIRRKPVQEEHGTARNRTAGK